MISPCGVKVVGKKGRSGRKSLKDEYVKSLVLKKAWGKVLKKLTNLEDNDIDKIALQLVLKEMGSNIDIKSGGKELQPILVKFINGKDKDTSNT